MRGIPVCKDNQGAIRLTENHPSSARSRHIDDRCRFIRTRSVDRVIRIIYVASREQRAVMRTRSLGKELFKYHRDALMGTRIEFN